MLQVFNDTVEDSGNNPESAEEGERKNASISSEARGEDSRGASGATAVVPPDDPSASSTELTEEEIHDVLSNGRRRLTLEFLRRNGGVSNARELSERIAGAETGEDPPPRDKRQSVYISLLQTHLPALDEHGILTYDSNSKRVELRDAVEQVAVYLDAGTEDGTTWSEHNLWVAILGVVTAFAAAIDVPIVSVFPPVYWAVFDLGVIGGMAAYRILTLSSRGGHE